MGLAPLDAAAQRYPGLTRLPYRLGTHRSFLEDLKRAIDNADPVTLALLDSWAFIADVTTFYQEVLANEQYVRTATEPRSLLELAALVGAKPRPGLSATTYLALTVAKHRSVAIERISAQSVPGPGEVPQHFESSEHILARSDLNSVDVRRIVPLAVDASTLRELDVRAASAPRVCDPLLLEWAEPHVVVPFQVTAVVELGAQRYRVALRRWGQSPPAGLTLAPIPKAYLLRGRASLFGSAAPRTPEYQASASASPIATSWVEPRLETEDTAGGVIYLDGSYEGVAVGSFLVIESAQSGGDPGQRSLLLRRVRAVAIRGRASYGLSQRVTRIELDEPRTALGPGDFSLHREVVVYTAPEELDLLEPELQTPVSGNQIDLAAAIDDFPCPRTILIVDTASVGAAELARVVATELVDGCTRLRLESGLNGSFPRKSSSVHANVVRATHGQTQGAHEPEVIGSADALLPAQRLKLSRSPLTHVLAENGGVEPALQLWVDGLPWTAVDSMAGLTENDRAYVVSTDEHGKATLIFGDGVLGARPPSGTENVRATYRVGLGKSGNIGPHQVTVLLERPLGLEAVTNPLPATGGVDPDLALPELLRDATTRVRRPDRVVSIDDYAEFARGYPGIEKAHARRRARAGQWGVELTLVAAGEEARGFPNPIHAHLLQELHRLGDPRQAIWIRAARRVVARLRAGVTVERGVRVVEVERSLRGRLYDEFGFRRRELAAPLYPSALLASLLQVTGVIHVDLRALDPPPPHPDQTDEPVLVFFDPKDSNAVNFELTLS